MYRAAYLIQEAFEDELPDGRYGQAIRSQLTAWITTERLDNLSVMRMSDKDRAIIADASNEFKKFRAKMATYGDKLFRSDEEEKKMEEERIAEEKKKEEERVAKMEQFWREVREDREKKIKKKRARSTEEKEKKPRKKRVKKPEAPKRPISAYMRYVQDNRPAIVAAHPDAKFTDIGKMLGIKWAKMTEAEKQVYHDVTAKDKERYAREMQERGLKMDLY